MGKRRKKSRVRYGLQGITLCISTALVLILLGMVVFSVLSARNLSEYVKENLTVTMMLGEDITDPEAQRLCKDLGKRPYINHIIYISKEQALKEQTAAMGTDPSEFIGMNPFVASIELQLKAQYANTDSLKWIASNLKSDKRVTDIVYPQDLMDSVNSNLGKINLHQEAVPCQRRRHRPAGRPDSRRGAGRRHLRPLYLRARRHDGGNVAGDGRHWRLGFPLRTAHHAVLRLRVGKQIPAHEGRRPVQNLTGGTII